MSTVLLNVAAQVTVAMRMIVTYRAVEQVCLRGYFERGLENDKIVYFFTDILRAQQAAS